MRDDNSDFNINDKVTQSLKEDKENISSLYKSVETNSDEQRKKLVYGIERHQIFSSNHSLFYVSSNFESLFLVKFHKELSGSVIDIEYIFKRIFRENPNYVKIMSKKSRQVKGDSVSYNGEKYKIYQIIDFQPVVFVLVPQINFIGDDLMSRMYFIYDSKRGRG